MLVPDWSPTFIALWIMRLIRVLVLPGEKIVVLFAVGHEIRRFIPNAKDFEYSDALVAGRRIQVNTVATH